MPRRSTSYWPAPHGVSRRTSSRDIASAPMSFWWPVTDRAVEVPYWWYVVALAVIIAIGPVRQRPRLGKPAAHAARLGTGKAAPPENRGCGGRPGQVEPADEGPLHEPASKARRLA